MCDGADCIDADELDEDSKTLSEWIAGCIRKHVKGGIPPKMTRDQCIAAAHDQLRKGKISRDSSFLYDQDAAEWIYIGIDTKDFDMEYELDRPELVPADPDDEIQEEDPRYLLFRIGKKIEVWDQVDNESLGIFEDRNVALEFINKLD